MRKRIVTLAAVCAVLLLGATALAAPQKPANVAGTWQLELVFAGRQSRAATLVLSEDGAKIKGTLGRDAKRGAPITGTVDGNKIAFATPSGPPNKPSIVQKFTGTVNGGTMSGTDELVMKGFTGLRSFMNGNRYVSWTAKRQK